MTDIEISFPAGKRVDAQVEGHLIQTDQPVAAGGGDTAPAPFDLFLASIGSCAGLYVVGFCKTRGIPMDGIRLVQRHLVDAAGHLERIELEIVLPESFPARYRDAVVHAAEGCKVKRTLAAPPQISVAASPMAGAPRTTSIQA